MALPYESSTSGERALGEIQKILRGFGCNKFGSMIDDREGVVLVQFEYRGREVSVKASIKGYAAAWLKAHQPARPDKNSEQTRERERKAMQVASTAVYSILRDWLKGQITAIETGILSFDAAFLAQTMLPGKGKTVLDYVADTKALPQLENANG
jgi:hypothetical protein